MVLPKNRLLRGIYLMIQRYLRHNVGIQSAALAFYLLFMIFPFLIFISALLGLLQLDVAAILDALEEIFAHRGGLHRRDVPELCGSRPQPPASAVRPVLFLYFPMRATNTLTRAVRTAYHAWAALGGGAPCTQEPAVHSGADRHHCRDADADDRWGPAAALRGG